MRVVFSTFVSWGEEPDGRRPTKPKRERLREKGELTIDLEQRSAGAGEEKGVNMKTRQVSNGKYTSTGGDYCRAVALSPTLPT